MLALSVLWLPDRRRDRAARRIGARLRPAAWTRWGWRALPALGAVAGPLGGWSGTAVYGRLFGTPAAL